MSSDQFVELPTQAGFGAGWPGDEVGADPHGQRGSRARNPPCRPARHRICVSCPSKVHLTFLAARTGLADGDLVRAMLRDAEGNAHAAGGGC